MQTVGGAERKLEIVTISGKYKNNLHDLINSLNTESPD